MSSLNQAKNLTHLIDHADIFICPACGGELRVIGNDIECLGCHNRYYIEDGIPLLFWPNERDPAREDVTDKIKSFYEKTPFPNYEDFEDTGSLVQKAQTSIFARLLNEQIPFNIKVLEVGCGTGQLSNFLGTSQRYVFGTDMCLGALKLGQDFKAKNDLKRVGFYQMNLFKPIFKNESFHLVICNGVLHHTNNPLLGFQSIAKLVKKDGYIILGLYNRYGRFITDIRRFIFNVLGNRFKFLDPRLRKKNIGEVRKATWFMDQYKNPHESKHALGEILNWFDENGFEFINSIPKAKAFAGIPERQKLFKPNSPGNWFDHFLVQLRLMFAGSREGGFFLMIGKKKF
ncbi:MAG: methyltransferase domain-containing protein [Candidatus Nealsonbacteria bacterium]